MRTAIFSDISPELKSKLKSRLLNYNISFGELYRQCTRDIIEMSEDDLKKFLMKAKKRDAEETVLNVNK